MEIISVEINYDVDKVIKQELGLNDYPNIHGDYGWVQTNYSEKTLFVDGNTAVLEFDEGELYLSINDTEYKILAEDLEDVYAWYPESHKLFDGYVYFGSTKICKLEDFAQYQ